MDRRVRERILYRGARYPMNETADWFIDCEVQHSQFLWLYLQVLELGCTSLHLSVCARIFYIISKVYATYTPFPN